MFCAWSVVEAGAGVVTFPTLPAPPAAPMAHVSLHAVHQLGFSHEWPNGSTSKKLGRSMCSSAHLS